MRARFLLLLLLVVGCILPGVDAKRANHVMSAAITLQHLGHGLFPVYEAVLDYLIARHANHPIAAAMVALTAALTAVHAPTLLAPPLLPLGGYVPAPPILAIQQHQQVHQPQQQQQSQQPQQQPDPNIQHQQSSSDDLITFYAKSAHLSKDGWVNMVVFANELKNLAAKGSISQAAVTRLVQPFLNNSVSAIISSLPHPNMDNGTDLYAIYAKLQSNVSDLRTKHTAQPLDFANNYAALEEIKGAFRDVVMTSIQLGSSNSGPFMHNSNRLNKLTVSDLLCMHCRLCINWSLVPICFFLLFAENEAAGSLDLKDGHTRFLVIHKTVLELMGSDLHAGGSQPTISYSTATKVIDAFADSVDAVDNLDYYGAIGGRSNAASHVMLLVSAFPRKMLESLHWFAGRPLCYLFVFQLLGVDIKAVSDDDWLCSEIMRWIFGAPLDVTIREGKRYADKPENSDFLNRSGGVSGCSVFAAEWAMLQIVVNTHTTSITPDDTRTRHIT